MFESNVPKKFGASRKQNLEYAAAGAAIVAALFAAPTFSEAQSHRPRSERHHTTREHRSRGGDLRREARRVRWTNEDEELFRFLEETIPYDRSQTGQPVSMNRGQLDEFAALLHKRTLFMLQQGQSERDQPGLLTTSLAAHDNEDGTVRTSTTFDGSLSHASAQDLSQFIRSLGHQVLFGHHTSVYYEIARDREERDYWQQMAILESWSDPRREQFDTSGDEMDQYSYTLRDLPNRASLETDYRSRPVTGDGRGRTPAEALADALRIMMFRPANQGTGRYGGDSERVFHFHLRDWNVSLTQISLTQPIQRIGSEWSISLRGTLLEPREHR